MDTCAFCGGSLGPSDSRCPACGNMVLVGQQVAAGAAVGTGPKPGGCAGLAVVCGVLVALVVAGFGYFVFLRTEVPEAPMVVANTAAAPAPPAPAPAAVPQASSTTGPSGAAPGGHGSSPFAAPGGGGGGTGTHGVGAAPAPPMQPGGTVTIRIQSQPTGAQVFADGAMIGQTPLELRRALGSRSMNIRVQADGYAPQEMTVAASQDQQLAIALEPLDGGEASSGQPLAVREGTGDSSESVETQATGSLSPEVIRRVAQRYEGFHRHCYDRELRRNPTLSGRITVQFVISGSGRVSSASVASSTMASPALESCVLSSVRRIRFPQPRDGGDVVVSHPLIFRPSP